MKILHCAAAQRTTKGGGGCDVTLQQHQGEATLSQLLHPLAHKQWAGKNPTGLEGNYQNKVNSLEKEDLRVTDLEKSVKRSLGQQLQLGRTIQSWRLSGTARRQSCKLQSAAGKAANTGCFPLHPRFEYRVKVGDDWYPEASGPSKKAARWLAAEEAMNVLKMTLSHLQHLQTPQKDELHAGGVELWGNAQLAEVND
ncbi:hypothetical protein JOQ06_000579 [Pogonophryne albipinna]|uniref:DRBM domain-containing protein n=1 Tax=Pogonophryne albipinna TaxID=1090488 RepID=A0AAD6AGF3_9TELE|nr:hypothetical protein JOQ06_000579 [Pogonophryne albipinna]